ncbi:MAG: RdgB/HAM1 family non-canonical purine NTP pyrophosphatase [Acidimicrobiia bacterium]
MKRPHGVVVASKNDDKIAEIAAVLGALDPPIVIIGGHAWPDIEETQDTLAGNALLKARAVCEATGHAAVADDTGLEVDALGGDPGIHTARYAGDDATYTDNVEKLLADLEGVTARTARFRTAIALVTPSSAEVIVEGVLEGVITTERRGSSGFGYDPVFEVPSDGRTLAEMESEEKNAMSHRAVALRLLADHLG